MAFPVRSGLLNLARSDSEVSELWEDRIGGHFDIAPTLSDNENLISGYVRAIRKATLADIRNILGEIMEYRGLTTTTATQEKGAQ
jgi:hypothetical protein